MKAILSWMESSYEKVITFLNVAATGWIFFMIMIVVVDVAGRILLNSPLTGTPEIIKISNPAIAFLQITYVLWLGRHIRSTVVLSRVSPTVSALINILTALMGIFVFVLNFYSGWDLTVTALEVGEYEGEGTLRVPTSPLRIIILLGSALMVIQFIRIIVHDVVRISKLSKAA